MQHNSNLPKIVVLGSAGVDFTTYAPRLPKPGETLIGTKFTTSYGGKGANQCVAAAKLGGNTYMICKLGDDQWGKKYKEYLKEVGVDVGHIHIQPNMCTGIAQICVADDGENQIVIVPGANNYLNEADVDTYSDLIMQADVIIAQLETPFKPTLKAFKLSKGLKILNAAPARVDIEEILPYCTILCVNEPEASLLTGLEVDLENVTHSLKKLLAFGCEIVIITLGANGAVYATRKDQELVHVMCENVTPIDTTGAGDAFVGALATFLISHKNYPIHQVIGAACYVASISVTKEGTQTSFPSNVKVFDKEYKYVTL